MTTSSREISCGSVRTVGSAWHANGKVNWCSHHGQASLNWLALGLLLAAWNASDDDAARPRSRPEALRRYSSVSVRAATLHSADLRRASSGIHESVNKR